MWRISVTLPCPPSARFRVAPGTAASTTFRMTLGSASPGSASGGDHQHPDGAFSIAGTRAIHVQFQPEMGEDMHDGTGTRRQSA